MPSTVDQSWTRPSTPPDSGFWALPLVLIAIVLVALVVTRRPWMLLALGLTLIVLIPLGSMFSRW